MFSESKFLESITNQKKLLKPRSEQELQEAAAEAEKSADLLIKRALEAQRNKVANPNDSDSNSLLNSINDSNNLRPPASMLGSLVKANSVVIGEEDELVERLNKGDILPLLAGIGMGSDIIHYGSFMDRFNAAMGTDHNAEEKKIQFIKTLNKYLASKIKFNLVTHKFDSSYEALVIQEIEKNSNIHPELMQEIYFCIVKRVMDEKGISKKHLNNRSDIGKSVCDLYISVRDSLEKTGSSVLPKEMRCWNKLQCGQVRLDFIKRKLQETVDEYLALGVKVPPSKKQIEDNLKMYLLVLNDQMEKTIDEMGTLFATYTKRIESLYRESNTVKLSAPQKEGRDTYMSQAFKSYKETFSKSLPECQAVLLDAKEKYDADPDVLAKHRRTYLDAKNTENAKVKKEQALQEKRREAQIAAAREWHAKRQEAINKEDDNSGWDDEAPTVTVPAQTSLSSTSNNSVLSVTPDLKVTTTTTSTTTSNGNAASRNHTNEGSNMLTNEALQQKDAEIKKLEDENRNHLARLTELENQIKEKDRIITEKTKENEDLKNEEAATKQETEQQAQQQLQQAQQQLQQAQQSEQQAQQQLQQAKQSEQQAQQQLQQAKQSEQQAQQQLLQAQKSEQQAQQQLQQAKQSEQQAQQQLQQAKQSEQQAQQQLQQAQKSEQQAQQQLLQAQKSEQQAQQQLQQAQKSEQQAQQQLQQAQQSEQQAQQQLQQAKQSEQQAQQQLQQTQQS